MLKIRFLKIGKKNQPFFRIVVTEKENAPKGGKFIEIVGYFNPFTKEKEIKKDRVEYWLSVGAQPSARVHNLLIEEKIIKGEKIAVHAKKKKGKETEPKEVKEEKEKTESKKTEEVKKEDIPSVKEEK